MAVTQLYAGTEAIGATEWSCTTDSAGPDADTTDGVMQLALDLADMVAGDVLEIRIYEKVLATSTQRRATKVVLSGAQSDPVWYSLPFSMMHGWDFTLLATSGTITVDWSIRQIS